MQLKNVGVIVVILVPRHNTLTVQGEESEGGFPFLLLLFLSHRTHPHTHAHTHTHTHSSLWFISDCAINALKATLYVVLAVSMKTL